MEANKINLRKTMKKNHIKRTTASLFLIFTVGTAAVGACKKTETSANEEKINSNTSKIENLLSDSLKVENLAKDLKKLKPLGETEFKAKFSKTLNGFQLTDVQAYKDKEKGSSAYAMYENGENHIYLSVADGADAGAEKVRENMISYLEIKKDVQPGDKTTIIEYKGWQSFFDESMFESDKMTAIHYLDGNRYNVVAQGTGVTLVEMKSFLDKLSL